MYKIYFFITHLYFKPLETMRKLEVKANDLRNKSVHHNKYGKGVGKCMMLNCSCKESK